MQRCRVFVFDCDGTLWDPQGLIKGASELLHYLKTTGRKFLLITNNSTKSIEEYYSKCKKLGLPVEMTDIVCTANVAANYISKYGVKGPLYIIGQQGLAMELDKVGVSHFGIGKDESQLNDFTPSELNPLTKAVLVGFDSHFNYVKLLKAASYIEKGCTYYATNEDAQLPESDFIRPGTGSIVAAVTKASGKEPIVFGKPNKPIFDFIVHHHNVQPDITIVVGDRLDTDILFANNFGMHSACVMTGVTSYSLLAELRSSPTKSHLLPEFVFGSVMDIYSKLVSLDETDFRG